MNDDAISREMALGAVMGALAGSKCQKYAVSAIKLLPALETTPKWISTSERLPEPMQSVLTHVVHTHSPDDGWWVIEDNMLLEDGSWEVDPDTDMHWITHWMPHPERPEEFRNAETIPRG